MNTQNSFQPTTPCFQVHEYYLNNILTWTFVFLGKRLMGFIYCTGILFCFCTCFSISSQNRDSFIEYNWLIIDRFLYIKLLMFHCSMELKLRPFLIPGIQSRNSSGSPQEDVRPNCHSAAFESERLFSLVIWK